jgi:ppGpp synthetase/RelA/SpoT-type nucleotidyltranferase
MKRLTPRAAAFLDGYPAKRPSLEVAAVEAETFVRSILQTTTVPIHAITSRAKSTASLRTKLRHKNYANPAMQVTDLIGVRVITYFAPHIDPIGNKLRTSLEVSRARSRDARVELESNEFGYRSLHLIARLRARQLPEYKNIGRRWFEIQIRSILDHAWSEIEHEVVYKSGIAFPSLVRRRFMAVAGSLEVLEHAFSDLSIERNSLVDSYRAEYLSGVGGDTPFDVARLWGYLEAVRPAGRSWRFAESEGDPFPAGLAVASVDALEAAGLNTSNRLAPVMGTTRFRRAIRDFAAQNGIADEDTSHLALVIFAVVVTTPQIVASRFPEFLQVPFLSAAQVAGLPVA